MDVIVTHTNTDFDGLGAMVGATLLYPGAVMLRPAKLSPGVQEFISLHKDSLPLQGDRDLEKWEVNRLIMVDTRAARRVGVAGKILDRPGLQVIIYDHHPNRPGDVRGVREVIEEIGAATTLVVEEIRQRRLTLTAFEATVLALGIYQDTGCLTFSTTTERDVTAVAYLLSQGANLKVVAEFIDRPLTEKQHDLLDDLLEKAETLQIFGISILLAQARAEYYISGLALLTHKLNDLKGCDVIITAVEMEGRVHLVARSRTDAVRVDELMAAFGGSGHAKAASAIVRSDKLPDIIESIRGLLPQKIRAPAVAREIMSTPVKTVGSITKIDEAWRALRRYGHTGLPVVDGPELVGIISRRDLDKARQHGLGHAPVKGYMSRNVVTISPDTPISEIQQLMIAKDIGRLPVLENGCLVGIISRTDVLRNLHGHDIGSPGATVYLHETCNLTGIHNVAHLLENRLPVGVSNLFRVVSGLAERLQVNVYVVGGFVRDLLLGLPNLDLDLVVEGDGPAFARELGLIYSGKVRVHQKFGTALVFTPDGFKIDVATARTEYYEYPAALPQVESSTIRQDLYRRDFSINGMAIRLNRSDFGDLIDFFNGRQDLEQKVIRVLYNLSFVEDPTRVLRAVRFEQRYRFHIESQTLALAKNAIANRLLQELSQERIRAELMLVLKEPDPNPVLRRMAELKIWPAVMPEIDLDARLTALVADLPDKLLLARAQAPELSFSPEMVYLLVLMSGLSSEAFSKLTTRFPFTKRELQAAMAWQEQGQEILRLLERPRHLKLSRVYRVLSVLPVETVLALFVLAGSWRAQKRIADFLQLSVPPQIVVTGEDMKQLGLEPGPLYRRIFNALGDARLDGLVHNKEEELALVRDLVGAMKRGEEP